MKAYELFGAIALDDKEYHTAMVKAERKTEQTGRKMQRDWDKNLSKMEGKLNNLGRRMQNIGGSLSAKLTAPIAGVGAAAVVAANRLGKTADRLLDLEQMTGLSTDRLQEFQNVARAAGVESEALSGAAEGLTRRLRAGGDESKTFTESLDRLGVTTRNADGSMRDMNDLMPEIIGQLGNVESITERNAIAMQVFGRRASSLAPVLALGSDEIERLTQEAHDMGQVMSVDALNSANEYRIEMEQLTAELGIAGREITQSLLPIMKSLVQFLRDRVIPWVKTTGDRVESAFEWFQSLSGGTKRFIGIAVGIAAALGPGILAFGTLTRTVSGLIGVIRTLRTLILLGTGPAGWLIGLVTLVGTGLVAAWAHWSGAVDDGIKSVNAARDAVGTATDRESLRKVVDDLAGEMRGDARQAFVDYATEALNTADSVEEAANEIIRQHGRISNSREIARLGLQESFFQQELDRVQLAIDAAGDITELQDLIAVKAQQLIDLQEARASGAQVDAQEIMALQQELDSLRFSARQAQFADLGSLEREAASLQGRIESINEEIRALSGEPVEVKTRVVPNPNDPNATPSNPTGLPTDGDEIDITINAKVNVADAINVTPEGDFVTGPEPGVQGGARVAGRNAIPEPGAVANVVERSLVPVPGVFANVAQGIAVGLQPLVRVAGAVDVAFSRVVPRGGASAGSNIIPTRPHANVTPGVGIPDPGAHANVAGPVAIPVPGAHARVGGLSPEQRAFNNRLSPVQSDRGRDRDVNDGGLAEANLENLRREAEERQKVIDGLTTVSAGDGPLEAFGKTLLDTAAQKVPAFGAALQGFAQGGPIGAVAAVFQQLLGESEAFQNILGMLNKALEPVVEVIDVLFTALTPLVEVAIALFQAGLQPLLLVLEHVVAPVFTAIANLIKGIWNGIAKALNAVLGIFGIKLPLIGEGGEPKAEPGKLEAWQEERQDLVEARAKAQTDAEIEHFNKEIRKIDEKIERALNLGLEKDEKDDPLSDDGSRREVNFGGTPQAVQLAVATPLVDAASMMLEAAMGMRDAFAGVGSNGSVFDRFAGALEGATPALEGLARGIDVRVSNLAGKTGRSSTAFLRGG